MTAKIEEHADHLLNAAADLRIAIKAKRYDEARQHAASVSTHRSVIIAIIEAVEELQPKASPPLPKKRTRHVIVPPGTRFGDLSRYILSQIESMKSGELKAVPPTDKFPIERLQGTVSSVCANEWGPGTYTTQRAFSTELDSDVIYVLRA